MATKTDATIPADQQATRDAIHRALPGPKGDKWSSAKDVCAVVPAAYSTVTQHLRAMVDAGQIETHKDGRSSVYRKTAKSPALRASDVVTRRAASSDGRNGGGRKRKASPVVSDQPMAPTADVAVETTDDKPVPQPPAAARTPRGGDVGAVVGFMEAVRPVSSPPAEPAKPRRSRRDPDASPVEWAVWQPGELQAAIVAHAQSLPQGESIGPSAIARALKSQPGSVAFAINSLVTKGNLVKVSTKPPLFQAA